VRALAEARQQDQTCLIYVRVEPLASIPGFSWWDVPVAAESETKEVRQARKAYDEARKKERFYY
jgi:3D-(3,5/4)-trihydroxycyclohexane-1,2-dione acylhydrolase (decyclizing)